MKQRQQLSDAIEDYERFRRSMDIAKSTLKVERSSLMKLLTVCGNIYMDSLGEFHMIRFFEEISKTKQPQSQRNDYRVLGGFFEWGRRTGRMALDNDPLYGRRKPKRVVREKNRVHVSQFPVLLDAAGARCARDRAAIALGLYTLLRDGEITDLRIRDLNLASGFLRARIWKTRQEDDVPISAELDREMRNWLTYYTNAVGFLEPHYYLVPSRDTRGVRGEGGLIVSQEEVRLCPERRIPALGKLVTPTLDDIGFRTKDDKGRRMGEGAHTLRRSGARALFDRLVADSYDGALEVVQGMLHHSSVTTTEIYIGVSARRRTRNELIRGREMYPALHDVATLRRETPEAVS